MYIVESYSLAVLLCIVTMLGWGSWGNTQKLAAKSWRYELFYWDYVIGIVLLSLILGFTLGSSGDQGRSFITDLTQVNSSNFWSAFLGGIIFNASNILLSTAISLAGMSVAFPVGVGIALVLGVFINYFSAPKGDPIILFLGVALIVIAIIFNGIASGKMGAGTDESKTKKKGTLIAVCAGILMAFFYRFVAASMDLDNLESPTPGMVTPYSAFFIFAIGILGSNFIFNTLVMKKPFVGKPVSYKQYFSGNLKTHSVGILGGLIWGLGTALSYIAAGKAGAAISYALGQGATMVAAFWGVFIWKEFRGASKSINYMLAAMFILFITGLVLIIISGGG
jgi:glucose uptake protein